jgi:hypothetical protein
MAHVIDTLFVELGLDTSKWTAGQKAAIASFRKTQDEAHKQAAAMEKSGEIASNFYKKLRNGVLTFFAALTAGRGIRDFIRDLSQGDANMGRLAASLGLATEDLAAWAKAVELAGGSASAATGTIASLTMKLESFKSGPGDVEFLSTLGKFGVSAQNANGTFKTTSELMMDISRQAAKMPAAQATTWLSQLGFDPDTSILLRKGEAEVQKLLSKGRGLGLATETDSKQMQQFNQDIEKLQTQILDLARTIFRDLEPSIHKFLDALSQWLEKNRSWIEGDIADKLRQVAEWFKGIDWDALGKGAQNALETIKQIVDAMGGWQTATEALIGLWLGAKAIKMLSMLALVFGGAGRLAGLGSILGLAGAAGVVTNMVTQGGDAMSGGQHGSDYSPTQWTSFAGHSLFAKPLEGGVKDRVKEAMDFFMSKGRSRMDAAVIVGNLLSENATLDPDKWEESGGGGYGIAQWTPEDRKASAGALVGRKTIVGASFHQQLEAVEGELSRGTHKRVGEALSKEESFLGKSALITRDYLSPKNAEAQIAPRATVGVRVLRTFPEKGDDAATAPKPAAEQAVKPAVPPGVVKKGQGVDMLSPSGRSRMMPPMSEGGTHVSMNVGDVTIHTAANDAQGIAKDMKVALAAEFAKKGGAMRLATQNNSGLA